jgi:hypothetical protein
MVLWQLPMALSKNMITVSRRYPLFLLICQVTQKTQEGRTMYLPKRKSTQRQATLKIISMLLIIFLLMVSTSCTETRHTSPVSTLLNSSNCLNSKAEVIALGERRLLKEFGVVIVNYRPYTSFIINDSIWVVKSKSRYTRGGGPYIELSSKTCRTLHIEFSK